jgi:hypothetical protein
MIKKEQINDILLAANLAAIVEEAGDEYLGIYQVRFRKPTKNLQDPKTASIMPGDGSVSFQYERPYAWCFDYEKLVERTGLDLETEFVMTSSDNL